MSDPSPQVLCFVNLSVGEKAKYRKFLQTLLKLHCPASDEMLESSEVEFQIVREQMREYFRGASSVDKVCLLCTSTAENTHGIVQYQALHMLSVSEGTMSSRQILAACRLFFHYSRSVHVTSDSVQAQGQINFIDYVLLPS